MGKAPDELCNPDTSTACEGRAAGSDENRSREPPGVTLPSPAPRQHSPEPQSAADADSQPSETQRQQRLRQSTSLSLSRSEASSADSPGSDRHPRPPTSNHTSESDWIRPAASIRRARRTKLKAENRRLVHSVASLSSAVDACEAKLAASELARNCVIACMRNGATDFKSRTDTVVSLLSAVDAVEHSLEQTFSGFPHSTSDGAETMLDAKKGPATRAGAGKKAGVGAKTVVELETQEGTRADAGTVKAWIPTKAPSSVPSASRPGEPSLQKPPNPGQKRLKDTAGLATAPPLRAGHVKNSKANLQQDQRLRQTRQHQPHQQQRHQQRHQHQPSLQHQPQHQHIQPQHQHTQPQHQYIQPQHQYIQPQHQHIQPHYFGPHDFDKRMRQQTGIASNMSLAQPMQLRSFPPRPAQPQPRPRTPLPLVTVQKTQPSVRSQPASETAPFGLQLCPVAPTSVPALPPPGGAATLPISSSAAVTLGSGQSAELSMLPGSRPLGAFASEPRGILTAPAQAFSLCDRQPLLSQGSIPHRAPTYNPGKPHSRPYPPNYR